jgi:hypothetical protein
MKTKSQTLNHPFIMSRRKTIGSILLGAGGLLSGFGLRKTGEHMRSRGKFLLNDMPAVPEGLREALSFPLIEALHGRRARRFSLGSEIPDGPLKYKSAHDPKPLSDLEQMLLLTAIAGNTGWHHMIYRNEKYAPHLANYSMAAGGRTFPSAAGFHTAEFFYTDDNGVYFLPTRDAHPEVETDREGKLDLNAWLNAHKKRIIKLQSGRLNIPPREPYMEGHNTWCVNRPGSTMVIPVADIAQHMLGILCFLVQNGYCIFDDYRNKKIQGMEKFRDLVDVDNPYPLSFIEQYALTEATAELSTASYAGMLMLQAMGLGGWMFDGIDRHVVLGASGDPEVPGLGFRYDTDDRWALPNVTGLPGVFEGFCPPHYPDMRAAIKALVNRKFGQKGPFNKNTKGPWKESSRIRSSAQFHDQHFQDCIAVMADYIYEGYGKFPAMIPSIFILTYLQAHNLDLDFYNKFFNSGAYLETHSRHDEWWKNS